MLMICMRLRSRLELQVSPLLCLSVTEVKQSTLLGSRLKSQCTYAYGGDPIIRN